MYGLLVVQQIIAATTNFVAKFANNGADAFTIVFLRGCITVAVFALWFAPQYKRLPRLQREDIPLILVLGFLNIPCNQVLFITGLKYTTPPNAALAYALVPAFTLAITVLLFKQPTTWIKVLGIALALTGTALVLFERGIDIRSEFFLGNMLELGAAFSWAWFSLIGKRLSERYGALYSTALAMFAGMLWYAPVFPFLPTTIPLAAVDSTTLLFAAYLGIITSVLGYFLWYYALSRIPASNVVVFSNLQPVFVTIMAIFLFGTYPSPLFLLGGACVLAGVVVTQRG